MPIRVRCPGCDAEYNLADELQGKRVRCKKCDEEIPVRAPRKADDEDRPRKRGSGRRDEETAIRSGPGSARKPAPGRPRGSRRDDDEDVDFDAPPRRRGSSPMLWIVLGVGAVVFLLMAGVGALVALWLLGSSSSTSPPGPVASVQPQPNNPPFNQPQPLQPAPNVNQGNNPFPNNPPPDNGLNNNAGGAPVPAPQPQPRPMVPPAPRPRREPPAMEPVAWTAKPDPLPEPLASPSQPKAFLSVTGFGQNVFFPTSPSPFVLLVLGSFDKEVRQVYNLATLKPAGKIVGQLQLHEPILSPDGAHLLSKPIGNQVVKVFSLADGKQGSIQYDDKPGFPDLVDFAGAGQIITVKPKQGSFKEHIFQIWDISNGQQVREFTGRGFDGSKPYAFSAGRKYLATQEQEGNRSRLLLYDLSTGTAAGALDVPWDEHQGSAQCKAIAFSPDGKEVAGLFSQAGTSRIVSWSMESEGKIVVDHSFAKDLETVKKSFNNDPVKLEWEPDRSGWLAYGELLIDHDSGVLLYTIPVDQGHTNAPRRLIGRDHVAVVTGPFGKPAQLAFWALPREAIDAEAKKARAAGSAVAQLPDAKSADWSGVKELPAPAGVPEWKVQPDAGPVAKTKLGAQPIPLAARGGNLERILFSSPDVGQAMVLGISAPTELSTRKQLRAERYDLAGGKALGALDLFSVEGLKEPRPPILASYSPDGNTVLVKDLKEGRRLDVWSLAESKHLVGWVPYEKETDQVISWATFVDSKHVATLNGTGKLVLWSVPECKAVFASPGWYTQLAVSPGGKYLAAFSGANLEVLDAATGQRLGALARPPLGPLTGILGLAFRPDGTQLAAVGLTGSDPIAVRWDLKNGSVVSDMPALNGQGTVEWCGNDHILFDQVLFDWSVRWPLARYMFPGQGKHASGTLDEHHWFAASRGANDPAVLVAQAIPDATVRELARQIGSGALKPLIAPGMTASIRVEGASPPGDTGFQKRILDQLTMTCKARKLQVVQGQGQINIAVSIQPERATGKTIPFRIMGRGQNIDVPEKEVAWQVTVTDQQGIGIWKAPGGLSKTPEPMFLHIQGNDVAAELNKMMWNQVALGTGNAPLPQFMVRTASGAEALPRVLMLNGG